MGSRQEEAKSVQAQAAAVVEQTATPTETATATPNYLETAEVDNVRAASLKADGIAAQNTAQAGRTTDEAIRTAVTFEDERERAKQDFILAGTPTVAAYNAMIAVATERAEQAEIDAQFENSKRIVFQLIAPLICLVALIIAAFVIIAWAMRQESKPVEVVAEEWEEDDDETQSIGVRTATGGAYIDKAELASIPPDMLKDFAGKVADSGYFETSHYEEILGKNARAHYSHLRNVFAKRGWTRKADNGKWPVNTDGIAAAEDIEKW